MLSDDCQIRFAESVEPDQFVFGLWQREQAVALGSGQDGTTGHVVLLLQTRVFDKPRRLPFAVRRINAMRFSQRVLEMIFSFHSVLMRFDKEVPGNADWLRARF